MFALTYVRLFLLVLLTIECTKGYHRRAVITNKFHVGALYDDFEIDSDNNNNNNERSPRLQVGQAIEALQRYNTEYNDRMKVGRLQGKTPKKIEFDRAQSLKPKGMKEERAKMKDSVVVVTSHARDVVLGILADSGSQGLETLRCWIRELSLPKGLLHAYDDDGSEIEVHELDEVPVYLKYNSTNNGDAYMKKNPSNDFSGVIFQPLLSSNVTEENNNLPFYQFGNLPLSLFR